MELNSCQVSHSIALSCSLACHPTMQTPFPYCRVTPACLLPAPPSQSFFQQNAQHQVCAQDPHMTLMRFHTGRTRFSWGVRFDWSLLVLNRLWQSVPCVQSFGLDHVGSSDLVRRNGHLLPFMAKTCLTKNRRAMSVARADTHVWGEEFWHWGGFIYPKIN